MDDLTRPSLDGPPPNGGIYVEGDFTIEQFCAFPAPLVANGALFVGCQLDRGHEGQHEVTIKWGT